MSSRAGACSRRATRSSTATRKSSNPGSNSISNRGKAQAGAACKMEGVLSAGDVVDVRRQGVKARPAFIKAVTGHVTLDSGLSLPRHDVVMSGGRTFDPWEKLVLQPGEVAAAQETLPFNKARALIRKKKEELLG